MANLKAIRKRVASVRNTQKITRAMKLVSAAKLRRAQQAMLELRPYAAKHRELLQSLARQLGEGADGGAPHPLLEARAEGGGVAILALSSDRGMCGGFNATILRKLDHVVREETAAGRRVSVYPLGKRVGQWVRKARVETPEELGEIITAGTPLRVREITARLVKAFIDGDVDRVLVVGNRFQSAIAQVPTVQVLLPVQPTPASEPAPGDAELVADLIYEPDQGALLRYVVPRYIEVQVRQAILESIAGEHAARMNAMSSATDNASEMIASLTLEMNRARQAAITKELMEIIGGAEAMK